MPTISGTVTDTDGNPASGYTIRFYRRDNGVLLGETLTGTGSAGASDPDFASVAVLLRFNEADGALTPVNLGSHAGFTRVDGTDNTFFPRVSSALPGFGNQLYCPVNGVNSQTMDVLHFTDAGTAGSTSFTLEGFLTPIFQDQPMRFWGIGSSISFGLSTSGHLALKVNGADQGQTATPVLSNNTRHFVRATFDRASTIARIYVDGTQVHTAAVNSTTGGGFILNYDTTTPPAGNGSLRPYSGYMDEVRLTYGGVIRTSPAVPAAPWPTNTAAPAITVGTYTFTTSYTGEVNVVCLDNAAGTVENDLILRTNVT